VGKRWPRINRSDLVAILTRMGLDWRPAKGDHRVYSGRFNGRPIHFSMNWDCREVDEFYVSQLLAQTGLSREQLYAMDDRTARQAQVKYLKVLPSEWTADFTPETP
jgi:hypothetical protein